jgi:hypothetical protein
MTNIWSRKNRLLRYRCKNGHEFGEFVVVASDAVPLGAEDTTASYEPAEGHDILDPEQSRRLSELFDLRDRCPLTKEEQVELNALVAG